MRKEDIKISIITPAFNEEKYIGECIESILNQNYPNFEMLIVDDGSVDNTADIVQKYQKADNRIQLLSLSKNVGLSDAKNEALTKVSGDYILFVDADDWILPCMLNDLVNQFEVYGFVDMFRLMHKKVYNRQEIPMPDNDYQIKLYSPTELIKENKPGGLMCNLCVKKEIVIRNELRFTKGMVMLADQQFTLQCMVYSKSVLYFTKKNYMYYQNPKSLSHNEHKDQFIDILNCAIRVYECAKENVSEVELKVYRGYVYQKAIQYLKRVLKNREMTALEVRSGMGKLLKAIDFDWTKYLSLRLYTNGIILSKFFY